MKDKKNGAEKPLCPCPFCGGVADFKGAGNGCVVVCVVCRAESCACVSEMQARAAWNRRAR